MSSEIQALSHAPEHESSFIASAVDGKIIDASSSKEEAQKRADAALSILHDTQLLLSKGVSEEFDSPLKRVVVTFPDHFYGFALADEKIYGTKRRVEP